MIDYHDGEELMAGIARWFAEAERNRMIAAEARDSDQLIRSMFKHWTFGAATDDCQSCGKAESVFGAIEDAINEALEGLRSVLDD